MNKKGSWLLSVLYVAVYLAVLFYLKRSGLWAHYRGTGLAFGTAWAVLYVLFLKGQRTHAFGLRLAIFFCLAGVIVLLTFLFGAGDSGDGFLAATFLGFGAPELYGHYKARGLTIEDTTSST